MSAKLDPQLLAVARVLFAREQLQIAVDRGASHRVIDALVTQFCAALEDAPSALGEPDNDFEFFPNHRGEHRRNTA